MTLNDLIRDAQTIANQITSGDISLTVDIKLELKKLGDNYTVDVILK